MTTPLSPRTPGHVATRLLGLCDFQAAMDLQTRAAEALKAGGDGHAVFLLEHPPVITLGANRKLNQVLAAPPGVPVIQTDRGGGATAHEPGQLVVYPVVHLRRLGLGVKAFVTRILEAGAALLAELGIPAEPRLDPLGLWVADRKIASMGIHVSRFVTTHGLAINLVNDLALFAAMVPCGLPGVRMTSAALELGHPVDLDAAARRMAELVPTALAVTGNS
ncbi:lipoyl(octanoyl) transferase LipB [Desulfolutivibrio sulfoxidireducens]|uniref:lipoyl(octanoyl) transferase LipB n=1 Tax=Desulfolutivibrio sulfoxidireducens TaxID=2773299 RepID=UPI00159EB7C2|nr:lipoyl(octanoyl) transferase LipB [Desulfolutivibrio sulfoxidireducens]QLA19531.1 lipoyl(octanoyl) transferase LipB [Desulfolutivibrio sulfoxidireducens]